MVSIRDIEENTCLKFRERRSGEFNYVKLTSFEGEMGQQVYVTEYDWHRTRRHYNCPGGWSKDMNSEVDEQKVNFVEEGQEVPYDE
ncbi:hypothetical protein RR46_08904 [Papilio xuthus]|uniref:Uncharacterized protein n=1 Tax=Papilio xuthus TaxID=66420 RepID=A0A194PWD5_PAPXU|nr:hypothetical protein RR46_08904 [Papilio xuthus]